MCIYIYIHISHLILRQSKLSRCFVAPLGGYQCHRRERVSCGRAGRGADGAVTRLELTMDGAYQVEIHGNTVPYTRFVMHLCCFMSLMLFMLMFMVMFVVMLMLMLMSMFMVMFMSMSIDRSFNFWALMFFYIAIRRKMDMTCM